jgi:type I restriction enzyme S subunit
MGENLYELPKGWIWARLDDISEALGGFAFKSQNYSEQGFQIIKIGNIKPGKLNLKDNKTFIDKVDSSILDRYLLKSDDILITLTGTRFKRDYGFVTIVKNENKLLLNQRVARLRFYPPLYPVYFCYSLQSEPFRDNFFQNETGNVGQGNVSMGAIKEEFIPLPPLAEQYRIVAKIEELFTQLDAGVELLKKVKAKLKRYRQTVLKAAVEGDLTKEWRTAHQGELEPASVLLERILKQRREKWEAEQLAKMKAQGKTPKDDSWKLKYKEPVPPDTSDLPDLPDGWCWVRAEQVCDFITKGTTPQAEKLYSDSGDIPFIKVYNLTFNGSLDFSINPTFIDLDTHLQELARSKVFPNDVLMNIVGPPLGKVSVVPELYSEWNMNQAIAVFRPMPSYNRMFLAFSLMTENILFWAKSRAKATAGQFNLTLEICRDLPLPISSQLEQNYIVEQLELTFSIIDQLEKTVDTNIKRAEKLRQSILKQAFTGQLVPQEPNDEPAEKLLERIKAEKAKQVTTKTKKKPKSISKTKSPTQLALPLE